MAVPRTVYILELECQVPKATGIPVSFTNSELRTETKIKLNINLVVSSLFSL